jgi:hypothetical protein
VVADAGGHGHVLVPDSPAWFSACGLIWDMWLRIFPTMHAAMDGNEISNYVMIMS